MHAHYPYYIMHMYTYNIIYGNNNSFTINIIVKYHIYTNYTHEETVLTKAIYD